MTTRFSAAADWLQTITGKSQPNVTEQDAAQNELMLRDAHSMSDLEARAKSRDTQATCGKRSGPVVRGAPPMSGYQQPKPKFVSHKTPKTQTDKAKKGSNRLGDQLHLA